MRVLVCGNQPGLSSLPHAQERWGHLIHPNQGHRLGQLLSDGLPWAADNGAFAGDNRRHPPSKGFDAMLDRLQGVSGCLWVAAPDRVGDWGTTLRLFDKWWAKLFAERFPIAVVLQDGATENTVPWAQVQAVFVGGSTEFKLSRTSRQLVAAAKQRNKLVHMGRVNTFQRFKAAQRWGCDSVDGSSFHMFPNVMRGLANTWHDRIATQGSLWEGE